MVDIISTGKLLDYRDFRKYSPYFIETGSGGGDGIQRALNAGFDPVISIEAQREYYDICSVRFRTQVRLIHGKSEDVLPNILASQPQSVIFLDAHPAGPGSAGHEEWLASSANIQDMNIRAELEIILSDIIQHVILIDDLRGQTDQLAKEYAELIASIYSGYNFSFYDEDLDGKHFFKDKILAAVPGDEYGYIVF